jgi:hypothetical protein
MAKILITDRKFYPEYGSSYSPAFSSELKGNILEKIRVETTLKVVRATIADSSNPLYFENDVNGLGKILRRDNGSWIDEGFKIGDTIYNIQYYTGVGGATSSLWNDTIASVTDKIIVTTNSHAVTGYMDNSAIINSIKSPHLTLKYNILGNDDTTDSTANPYSSNGEHQYFYFDSIDTATPTVHTMKSGSGNKNWLGFLPTVEWLSDDDPLGIGVDYRDTYIVKQEFIIAPFSLEEFKDNYNNGSIPDILAGNKSLKYIAEYEFRSVATDSNTGLVVRDNLLKGNVGWIGENFNGRFNDYSVSNVTYEDTLTSDSVDSLQSGRKTTVKGNILGTGFANNSQLGIYFFHDAPQSQYSVNQGSLQDCFLYDSLLATLPTASTVTATDTGIIKRFKVNYIDATHVTFEADIELTSGQKTYVGTNDYFLGVQCSNGTGLNVTNKSITQIDFNTWTINPDVEGLATFSNQEFFPHNIDESDNGHTDLKGWKGDGCLFKSKLILNKLDNANLKSLQFRIVAYNSSTGNLFELQKYDFNLANAVVVNSTPSYQQLNISTTRGFKLAFGDQFDFVRLTMGNVVSNLQTIDFAIGFKLDYQSWIVLKGADTIFYDTNIDSKGMGLDASRYSLNNGYAIKICVDAQIKQLTEDSTLYRDLSPDLDIQGWDVDGNTPAKWSKLIETFDEDDNDLDGAILGNAYTKFRTTWTPDSGSTSGWYNAFAIHRIDSYNSMGQYKIYELSSLRDYPSGNLLKPLTGETNLKITDTGTEIVTECLIDYTKLKGNYNLQSRLGRSKVYGRYKGTSEFKFLDAGKTEALLFNGEAPWSIDANSLRLAQLDASYNVVSEVAIALSNSYDYLFCKIAVDENEQSNGKNVFYLVSFDGTATHLHRFAYNGTTFIQSLVFNGSLGGSNPTCIRIDPELSPNGRAFIWFGNRQAAIGAGYGMKTAYWNGASWVIQNVVMYNVGDIHTPLNPQDIIFHNGNVYIQNYDQGTSTSASQQEQGKIGIWQQTSGSSTSPTDRADFSNYAWQYDIYRNATDHENVNGAGNFGDMAYSLGMEISEIDANNNPILLATCQSSLGGRQFVRIRANVSVPINSTNWTIENPMGDLDGLFGTPTNLSGTASSSAHSDLLPDHYGNHLAIIDGNTFISGSHNQYFYFKVTISSWTGASNNNWVINAPNDPSFNFTQGSILTT